MSIVFNYEIGLLFYTCVHCKLQVHVYYIEIITALLYFFIVNVHVGAILIKAITESVTV